jgi:putative endonuclease
MLMAQHNETGKMAEEMAVAWLVKEGFSILERNLMYGSCEVDIIASKGKYLHFVEVKSRYHNPYCHPESSVGKTKFRHMQAVASHYLRLHPKWEWIRYDILAITLHKFKEADYFWIEDFYY